MTGFNTTGRRGSQTRRVNDTRITDLGTESARERPLDLYAAWEARPWRALDYKSDKDRGDWAKLGKFASEELSTALSRFFLGELSVTAQTLGSLAMYAPTTEAQLFLCTQLADEVRHTVFFFQYLQSLFGSWGSIDDCAETQWSSASASFRHFFDNEIPASTNSVRDHPDDQWMWHRAVITYHLIGEGVLASTFLASTRQLLSKLGGFGVLQDGLRNVSRDEARHVRFGVRAIGEGAKAGLESAILGRIVELIPPCVDVLVDPERKTPLGPIPAVRKLRLEALTQQWQGARGRLIRRLSFAGLAAHSETIGSYWDEALAKRLDRYEVLHGQPHPVRKQQN